MTFKLGMSVVTGRFLDLGEKNKESYCSNLPYLGIFFFSIFSKLKLQGRDTQFNKSVAATSPKETLKMSGVKMKAFVYQCSCQDLKQWLNFINFPSEIVR